MKATLLFLFICLAFSTRAQKPQLIVPVGHTQGILDACFSPDGKYILTGSEDGTAKLWDLSGREVQVFKNPIDSTGFAGSVLSVTFSPDGKTVLTGSDDATARLWDLNGKEIQSFSGHQREVTSVAFSPDGKTVLTGGSADKVAKLWDLSGKEVQIFSGHSGGITSVRFSPDGKMVLTGSGDRTAKLWDLNGQEIQTFSGHKSWINAVAFSPNGNTILTGGGDRTAKLWRLNGQEIQTFSGHKGHIRALAFSRDGNLVLTGSEDNTAKLWDLSGNIIKTFNGHHSIVTSADFSFINNKGYVLTGSYDQTAILWDMQGGEIQTFNYHSSKIWALEFSSGNDYLLVGEENRARLWNLRKPGIQVFDGKYASRETVSAIAISPDNKNVLVSCCDSIAILYDMQGRIIQTFSGHSSEVTSLAFSPNGKNILTGSSDNYATLWSNAGRKIKDFYAHDISVKAVNFSPDGKLIVTGGFDDRVKVWDLKGHLMREYQTMYKELVLSVSFSPNGKLILVGSETKPTVWDLGGNKILDFPGLKGGVSSAVFSPDGQHILIGTLYTAILFNLQGNQIQTFSGHNGDITTVAFSNNGKMVWTGSFDNTIKLWDTQSGQNLATLIALDSTDWVVTTPAGLFDASPGAMKLMHYVAGLEVIELEQLKERYYEPFLLAKLMGFAAGGLRPVDTLNKVALYPAITKASIDGDRLRVQLAMRNGGIGRVALFLGDDIELEPNINPAFKPEFEVDLGRYAGHFFPDSLNRLSLRAYNREGWLKGPAWPLEYRPAGVSGRGNNAPVAPFNPRTRNDSELEQIHLYALVVGTSTFRGAQLNLKYPDKDAAAFAEALRLVGTPLFGKNIEIKLLTTSAEPWPRKAEIARAFQNIAAKAGPADILLVYLSGHGITYPPASEKGQFYYLTTDILGDKLDDPATLQAQAIGQDTLQEWIRQVYARKRILILDACNSGRVVEVLGSGEKALNSDQRRALEQMKDRSGMFVIAGSAADKSSFEAGAFGHGLLTYSLLNNMPIVAAANKDLVSVDKLFGNVREEVPRLARDIGKEQEPELIGAKSFGIGIVNDTVHIAVPKPLPVFVRVNFIDSQKSKDLARLSAAANACLEQRAGEREAPLAFWNVDDFAGDYFYIGGQYRQAGGAISGTAKLFRKDEELATFPFSGAANAVDKLAEKIVEQAFEVLDRLK